MTLNFVLVRVASWIDSFGRSTHPFRNIRQRCGFRFGSDFGDDDHQKRRDYHLGTTGIKPKTAVPPGFWKQFQCLPSEQKTVAGPGAGAGTLC